jgi:hypothetical protein
LVEHLAPDPFFKEINPMRTRYLFSALSVAGLALVIALPSLADEAPSKEKIDKLIKQMGSDAFSEREKATKELAAIGLPALEALRKAARSDDAEVRRRAGKLLPNIERRAERIRILAPVHVHLVYKDTPLHKAVADFQEKSGYTIYLLDPEGKLKVRKITLETGETTFWHALALFCEKAEISQGFEDDLPDDNPWRPESGREIILKDGKSKKMPTDDRCAVRIQVTAKDERPGNWYEGELTLPLEVSLEPKLTWNGMHSSDSFLSIHIDKAVDDQGQKLSMVIPKKTAAGEVDISSNPPRIRKSDPQSTLSMSRHPFPPRSKWGAGLTSVAILDLRKGAKQAKSLKELKGILTMKFYSEVRPVIVVDKLDKAAGKTFKGAGGSSITIVKVVAEEEQTTLELELHDGDIKRQLCLYSPGECIALAGLGQFTHINWALCVQDAKGKSLPRDDKLSHGPIPMQKRGNDGRLKIVGNCSFLFRHDRDKGRPARVIYLGRRLVTVKVPFALKDVPLQP